MKELIISIGLSLFLAGFAYYKKAMTNSALLVAFIFSVIITYFGGVSSFLMLATVFLLTVVANLIKKEVRINKTKDIHEKGHKKDIRSIIANVAPGTFTIIFYGLTNNHIYLVIFAALMSEAISDSLASDIGILSNKPPINILTFKKSTPGLSGNISLLGMLASLIGSACIAGIYYAFNPNFSIFAIITICGFMGNLIDSFLGAILQVKYKCPKCHIITEKETHCNTKTIICNGEKRFNNDTINLISNILTGVLCYFLNFSL